MALIDTLFRSMIDHKGSDLHLMEGQPPKTRVHGELEILTGQPALTRSHIEGLLSEIAGPEKWKQYLEGGDLDFAYEIEGLARFRANYLKQYHGLAAVF